VNDSDEEKKRCEEEFKNVNEAYSILSDKDKRRRYDQFGSVDASDRANFNADSIFNQFFRHMGGFGFGPEDFGFDQGGFRSQSPFGGFGPFGQRSQSRRSSRVDGEDLLLNLRISFEEAYRGASKPIKLDSFKICDDCHGSGGTIKACDECGGVGMVTQRQDFMVVSTTCPKCHGTGSIVTEVCKSCHGSGIIGTPSDLTLNIPAGSYSGLKLRVPGRGKPGRNGGEQGNLIILLSVEPSKDFTREEDDLVHIQEVKVEDLVCGRTFPLSLFGEIVQVTVPELYDLYKPIIIPNLGFKSLRSGSRGDLVVRLKLARPTKKLTQEEKKALKDLLK